MFQEQIDAYAPQLREAFKAVAGQSEAKYYKQEDLNLASSADTCPWDPSRDVRCYVENIDIVQVQLIHDDSTDLDAILNRFIDQGNIGLILMGPNVTRFKKPALIVLTTNDVYYAIDPNFNKGIKFLDQCLRDERLTIWTTNGFHESNCLLKQFNISLLNSQARDCLGVHMHLMKIIKCLSTCEFRAHYPERALHHAKRSLRLENFDKLIYVWLGIDDMENIHCNVGQLGHLTQRPLNLTATNLIKKRCALVLRLAECLMYYAKLEHNVINNNVINTLVQMKHSNCEDGALKYMRKYISREETNKTPIKAHFAHLDEGEPLSD